MLLKKKVYKHQTDAAIKRRSAEWQKTREAFQALDKLKAAEADVTYLLGLVADIRAAVGDPTGYLMQDELIKHCRNLVEGLELAVDALLWISKQPTDEYASATQCSMVAHAQETLEQIKNL